MKVFTQNKHSHVLFAFGDVVNNDFINLRWAAYATLRGCERLLDRISTQIGAHNFGAIQKERFFGFAHVDYDDDHVTIRFPILTVDDHHWDNRPLTWHGNNKMERVNLPTLAQGGYRYEGRAVLFRRHIGGFEIKVAEWNNPTALSWRSATESLNTVFRLGPRGTRLCGFF